MPKAILGISAFYHDSAAALLIDGEIIAAASEERFTRKKHDSTFPLHAVRYVLSQAGLELSEVELVSFYDKPFIKFERLLETYHAFAPSGLRSFLMALPVWMNEKLFMRELIRRELKKVGKGTYKTLFPEHHLSHAASAFYPSPFNEAAILTIDGVGEWATTTICKGSGNQIEILKELSFPHSLGLLYSAVTYYAGFKVNSGEYKLMGLAPYGNALEAARLADLVKANLADIREDGSLLLNMSYFEFAEGLRMTRNEKWEAIFAFPARLAEDELTQPYMDLALAIQMVTEEIVLKLAKTAQLLTGSDNLVMAGGVALNCVANGKLARHGIFKNIWLQPAAGDAGGALGAALAAHHIHQNVPRSPTKGKDAMKGAYLGPEFTKNQVAGFLHMVGARYVTFSQPGQLYDHVAKLLDQGKVVGWFQGRMEFGPRALGNRSILGDARNKDMQKRMNLKIKYREGFRPFAPSVLEEDFPLFFEGSSSVSPYMLMVFPVHPTRRTEEKAPSDGTSLEKLYTVRSDIPAVTHLDYSARVQTVAKEVNPRFWSLLNAFKDLTGYGILVNSSFNVRGEPIVHTPREAYQCFMRTEMDYLVIDDFVLAKEDQPEQSPDDWQSEFELD